AAVGPRDLDIGVAGSYEVQERVETGLPDAERRLRSPEMVEDDRDRARQHLVFEAFDDGEPCVDLHMPGATLDPLDCRLQTPTAGRGIGEAGGFEIDPDSPNAAPRHLVERGVRCLVINHGDAASVRSELPDRIERARVVRAVNARL